MTQLQELKKMAKERGLKGYSTLNRDDLCLLLAGKPVPKKLRKNQVSVETQTDFPICDDCGLQQYAMHLCFKAAAAQREKYPCVRTAVDVDMIVCLDCGLVLEESVVDDKGGYLSHKKRATEALQASRSSRCKIRLADMKVGCDTRRAFVSLISGVK